MRILFIIKIYLFTFSQICMSQEITYKYPLSLNKFTNDVISIELSNLTISDFDTLKINHEYEIESPPTTKRYMKDGRLIKSFNYQDNLKFIYHYDEKGNIQSRNMNSSDRSKKVEYRLDQVNLKLEAISEGIKREEIYFDSLNREIIKIFHSYITRGEIKTKILTTYNGSLISNKKRYEDELLQETEEYEYKNDTLKNIKRYDKSGNLLETKSFIYYKNRTETKIKWFKDGSQFTRQRIVEFQDKKGNLTKSYRIGFKANKQTASITEFKLFFEE